MSLATKIERIQKSEANLGHPMRPAAPLTWPAAFPGAPSPRKSPEGNSLRALFRYSPSRTRVQIQSPAGAFTTTFSPGFAPLTASTRGEAQETIPLAGSAVLGGTTW